MYSKKTKNYKGITLVALVITIIVLLILAGVTINLTLGERGIFRIADKAAKNYRDSQQEEMYVLNNLQNEINDTIAGLGQTSNTETSTIPNGESAEANSIITWLKCANIEDEYSYTTIEEVVADNTCTEKLMNNENAMKYLARSTEFANSICANETAMTYLGQSTHVDETVLKSDIWQTKIKASQYWPLVYTTTYTIHAGASETITIDGVYGSFTTNSDGSVNHALPTGELTFHGSVSGQSFTRTVNKETTEVKVMPEGLVVYWYGNEVAELELVTGSKIVRFVRNENNLSRYTYNNSDGDLAESIETTKEAYDISNFNKLCFTGYYEGDAKRDKS